LALIPTVNQLASELYSEEVISANRYLQGATLPLLGSTWVLIFGREKVLIIAYSTIVLASYPGLITPAFVTCSANAGKAW